MNLSMVIATILFAVMFIVLLLYVLFGQLTVRKLRKNRLTKNELGIEFVSGWDILNVAQALTVPRKLMQKFNKKQSFLSAFYANTELLYKHTSLLDRILARMLYVLFVLCGTSVIILGILEWNGIFD